MSSLPPSQLFLNAPDDFCKVHSSGPTDGVQPSTASGSELKTEGSFQEKPSNRNGRITANGNVLDNPKAELQQNATATNEATIREQGTDHEMHYGSLECSVRGVIKEILDDLVTHKNLHDWDKKLVVAPFKKLETVIRSYLARCSQELLNDLLIHSSMQQVIYADKKSQSASALQQDVQAKSHFFFSKPKLGAIEDASNGKDTMSSSPGRVICVKECQSHDERAVLLWVHALGIRLKDEDNAYIRNFIERHLDLKSIMATPYHWQPASPPENGVGRHQKHYRRVSVSFHLTYLTMSVVDNPTGRQMDLDRIPLFSLSGGNSGSGANKHYLYRASSSILITLVIPEESPTREEETKLLKSSQGLWTVLMINYPRKDDQELNGYLTPISQFVRGIAAALVTQRHNAESICDFLRHELQSCDVDGLFDDEYFTKSNTYHRTIQGCSELKDSLDSTLRFMTKLDDGPIKELRGIAHPQEKPGVEHWVHSINEELFSLRELRAQIEGLNKRAQESRAALHGATAVLEARTALKQGERLKVLAYLATLYLPLTATSSIYSMSVLPKSASFASFFVVFVVLSFFTISPNIYRALLERFQLIDLSAFRASIHIKSNASAHVPSLPRTPATFEDSVPEALIDTSTATSPTEPKPEPSRLARYLRALGPRMGWSHLESGTLDNFKSTFPALRSFPLLFRYIFWEVPKKIAFCYLIPELWFPLDQYKLYRARESQFFKSAGWKWHPLAFVRDIFRALLLPLWATIILFILSWLILLSILYVSFLICLSPIMSFSDSFRDVLFSVL